MAIDEKIEVTINWFRDPPGGYRVLLLKITQQEKVRLDNRREPPEGSGVLGSIGFWLDIEVPIGTTRAAILNVLDSVRISLEKMELCLLEPLWANGQSSFERKGIRVTLGGGTFPGNQEYLVRFGNCLRIFSMFTDLKGIDITI